MAMLLRLATSVRETRITPCIQCPASFGNRVLEMENNAPDLSLFVYLMQN